MNPPLAKRRLSLREVQALYGVSRGKLETLIRQGFLVPEHILHGRKRYFKPAEVEALFTTPRAPRSLDIEDIMEDAYRAVMGHPSHPIHEGDRHG
jgi:Helix-turn-helix domain